MGAPPVTPKRPVLRYHGGKWKLAPWLLEHFPPHRVYVEPFGGAASVLMLKERSYGEVYNDMDDGVVTVFRVLRDPAKAAELRRRLELTPFARAELKAAYADPVDDIDAAHKMIVRAFMGFGSASMTRTHMTGFRFNANQNGTTPAKDWMNWPKAIDAMVARLRGVVIENKDFAEVTANHDGAQTLIYADPPYVPSTRASLNHRNGNGIRRGASPGTSGHYYRCDMSDDDHRRLAVALRAAVGMVIVSGYPCDLYDRELYSDWIRAERQHMADGARPRTEVIWMNSACYAALEASRSQLQLIR